MTRILLLEDDLSLVNGLSFAFKKQGFETDIARTLREAEAFWAVGNYDLLVLDVSLPDGTGFGFCERVRQTSKVPIIFLTASDEETSIIMGLDMGGDDYITKPFKLGRRSYDVRPGLGFLCQSHNPDVTYFYPKGAKDPWTFVYMCFSGSSAVAMADDLVRRHGPIFALDTSDPFVSRMMEYADIAPDGSMVTPVADGAYLVAGLMHRLLSNVQSHPSGDSAPVSAPEANVKLADPPASNYKGDPK